VLPGLDWTAACISAVCISQIVTEQAAKVPVIFLPPRPKLDPYVADKSPRHEIDDTPFATVDFCVSSHLGFEKERVVIDLRGHQNRPGGISVISLDSGGGKGADVSVEALLRVCASFQYDLLPHLHIANLILGDGNLRLNRLELMDLRDEVSLLNILSDLFFELRRCDQARHGAYHTQELYLVPCVAALRLQT
jgi:hypothetical protein